MTSASRLTMSFGRVLGFAVIALTSLAVVAPRANAQGFRMGQFGMQGAQTISADDLKMYAKVLALDDAQKQAMQALHEAYLADRDKADKEQRDQMRKIREEFDDSRDPSVWQNKMPDIMTKYGKQTAELDKSFLSDLKALLTPAQANNWTTLERTHRRAQAMPGGMLAGESVDLVSIVNALNIAKPPSELTDTLDRYSSELDGAIQERTKTREELGKQLQDAGRPAGGGMPDFQAMQKVGAEMRKAGLKVREINDRYTHMIQSVVPTDKQADFETKVKKARFPTVYTDSNTLKSLDAAAKFTDLNETQVAGIKDVRESYTRDLDAANERLTQAIAKAEADGGGDDSFNIPRWLTGGGAPPPDSDLTKARKARREVDRSALDKLKALLNESQVDRLPDTGDQGPGFGGGGGGGNRGVGGRGGGGR